MKKLLMLGMSVIISSVLLTGCGNIGAKSYSGEMTVELQKGQKLVNATWKDADLWYLTKDMNPSDKAETYTFKENSTLGGSPRYSTL